MPSENFMRPMNSVHASMSSYFPVRFDQINLLQYVSRSSTPCLDLWGIFSGDFVPLFPCGFISCPNLLDFLWQSQRFRVVSSLRG